ncbi:MAG: hypothetical protein ACREBS_11955, partial [Nitrososphaerales archaeon]
MNQPDRFKSMLSNEREFDRLFCDVIQRDRFSLFFNERFADDPVFNHATIASAILESTTEERQQEFQETLSE